MNLLFALSPQFSTQEIIDNNNKNWTNDSQNPCLLSKNELSEIENSSISKIPKIS